MLWPRILADVIVVLHVAYVAFVVLGMVAIVVGLIFHWAWVRNFWFRVIHLAMIAVVSLESLAGIACPLTTWENALRTLGGQKASKGEFVASWMHRLIFFHAEPWVFTLVYCLFGAAVALTFLLGAPRWPGRRLGTDDQPAEH
jgi:hypothetical protein